MRHSPFVWQPPETEGEGGGRRRKKFEDDQERIKEQEEAARAERERVDAVMRTLAQIEGAGVSTNKLGSLVGTDADFIREVCQSELIGLLIVPILNKL